MKTGGGSAPSPGHLETFVCRRANPVNLQFGPGGDLFYPDFDGGTIRRIHFVDTTAPTVTSTTPTNGATGVAVGVSPTATFSEPIDPATLTTSTFTLVKQGVGTPLAATVSYDDPSRTATLNPDVSLEPDATYAVTVEGRSRRHRGSGRQHARLRRQLDVPDERSHRFPLIDTPAATLTWHVGELVSFSGHATDPEQGTLPASSLSWTLLLQHCPSNCHSHTVQTWNGVGERLVQRARPRVPVSSRASADRDRRELGRPGARAWTFSPKTVELLVPDGARRTRARGRLRHGSTSTGDTNLHHRHDALGERADPTGSGRHDLPLRLVVGRSRTDPQHRRVAFPDHLHRDLRDRPGERLRATHPLDALLSARADGGQRGLGRLDADDALVPVAALFDGGDRVVHSHSGCDGAKLRPCVRGHRLPPARGGDRHERGGIRRAPRPSRPSRSRRVAPLSDRRDAAPR